jgi:hypothetical protein
MLVKPLTSLALCALAVSLASPARAALDGPASSTLVVSGSNVGTPPVVVVKVSTHRPRRALHRKPVTKVVVHHGAEPTKTPVVPAAVITTHSTTHLHLTKVKDKHYDRRSSHHPKGEIMIGPKVDAKVVVAPSKAPAPPKVGPVAVPASIEVKTETVHPRVKIEVKPAKASAGLRPVAEATVAPSGPPAASLDVATGETKLVAGAVASGAAPVRAADAKAKAAVAKAPCLHEAIELVRGQEAQSFSLTRCDGSVAPLALEKLSILARPDSAPLPKAVEPLARAKGPEIAAGIRRVDTGLALRLQAIADHFSKGGQAKMSLVSGYRPMSSGSYHATAQALDLRIEGVPNEAVVEFCKTLADTGCGYYPNSSFVHVDVRQPGTGHVAWIDASGPGEAPRYVASWPPPPEPEVKSAEAAPENPIDKLDPELPQLPAADEHPATPTVTAVVTAPLELAK